MDHHWKRINFQLATTVAAGDRNVRDRRAQILLGYVYEAINEAAAWTFAIGLVLGAAVTFIVTHIPNPGA
jgi:hypothetical protein